MEKLQRWLELKSKQYFSLKSPERKEYQELKKEFKDVDLKKIEKESVIPMVETVPEGWLKRENKLEKICKQLHSQILDGHARSACLEWAKVETNDPEEIKNVLLQLSEDPRIIKDSTAKAKVLRTMDMVN